MLRNSVLRACIVVFAFTGIATAGDLRVIVGFKGDADATLVKKHGARPGAEIVGLRAMTALAPGSVVARLRADPAVAYVEEDGYVSILGKPTSPPGKKPKGDPPPPQETPWGIDRVGGGLAIDIGFEIRVAVIDTGIDSDHSDLAANIKGGVDFTGSRKGSEDEHGHGTHVSGTIAGVDNTIGVIGVAPGAHLYAVRVLDRRGSGWWSDVAAGITWTGNNGIQIANMSLGGGPSNTVRLACEDAAGKGVLLLAAAGNSGDGNTATTETSYPAAYPTVVAVGATDSNDGLASFSNSGGYLEVSGPGVGVKSTYKKDDYRTWSGTSMACPHAAGVAALIWSKLASPTASTVRPELQRRVNDFGPGGWDSGYGYGIVDYGNP